MGRVARFRIPLDGSAMGELETVLDPDEHGRGVELSTINPAYVGKEYRYLYACTARRPCNFFNALTKMDLVEKETRRQELARGGHGAIGALLRGQAGSNQ